MSELFACLNWLSQVAPVTVVHLGSANLRALKKRNVNRFAIHLKSDMQNGGKRLRP